MKQIIAETEESQPYFSPSNECKSRDLSCSLYNSVIVWTNVTKSNCPFTKIHIGSNYTLSDTTQFDHRNIIYSLVDNLSFQLTNVSFNCNIRMFSTSFENDLKAIAHSYLDVSTKANSFNKQHDINNLLLAEVDSYKHYG